MVRADTARKDAMANVETGVVAFCSSSWRDTRAATAAIRQA
jgi:hypothetical protein